MLLAKRARLHAKYARLILWLENKGLIDHELAYRLWMRHLTKSIDLCRQALDRLIQKT